MSEEVVTVFEFGGKEYDVVKKGFAQAEQVASLGTWLSENLSDLRLPDKDDLLVTDYLIALLGNLTGNSLVELFAIVFGCTLKDAKEEFDFGILIEGLVALYSGQKSFKRIIDRFFSTGDS